MKVLLIGGAGMLGTHLGPALQLAGHDVFIADNFSGSKQYRTPKVYPVITCDATQHNNISYVLNRVKPDIIMLMVGYYYGRDTNYSFYDESKLIINSANTLASLLTPNIKHVYFFSHSDVYGGPETSKPISEGRKIISSSSFRGAANFSAEHLISTRCAELKVPLTTVRLFEMVGPRIQYTAVSDKVNFIIDSFLLRQQIGLGGAKRKRDFIHVDDVVSAVIGLAEKKFEGVVNIGSGAGTTLKKVCDELSRLMKVYYSPIEVPDRATPSYSAVADVSLLKGVLPYWEPKVDIIEYLPDLLEFRRKEEIYNRQDNAPNILRDQRKGG